MYRLPKNEKGSYPLDILIICYYLIMDISKANTWIVIAPALLMLSKVSKGSRYPRKFKDVELTNIELELYE